MIFIKQLGLCLILSALFFGCTTTTPNPNNEGAEPPEVKPSDYSLEPSWLCRPGRDDACTVNLDTTVIDADGTMTVEPFVAAEDPQFDCFYVYPTVSLDSGGNSDMIAGPEEISVVKEQLSRYRAVCRTFAPLYRQTTTAWIRATMIDGGMMDTDPIMAYIDVLAAWNYYLENFNNNRGVILIGHSQGTAILSALIKNEIEIKPVSSRIIGAHLFGQKIGVPKGLLVGGDFQFMPLCASKRQAGCILTYSSFRSDVPPPKNTIFRRVLDEGVVQACTNPAALGGGSGPLHAYLSAGLSGVSDLTATPGPWTSTDKKVTTPFVSLPGMLSSECVANENGNYLLISVHGDPTDKRVDDIVGELIIDGTVRENWGLHVIDMNLAMGNLIDIASMQYEAWQAVQD